MLTRWRSMAVRQTGQSVVLAAFSMALLIGFVALVIDVGTLFVEKRQEQNAADAAALAGAGVLLRTGSTTQAIAAARSWAEENGYDNDGNTAVTVNIPPTSGAHAGDPKFTEVKITREIGTFFAAVLGRSNWDVEARAAAGITSVPQDYGIIALNRTACPAIQFVGNANITVNNAGIMDNSSCTTGNQAFYVQGNATITSTVNHVVGGTKLVGNVTVTPPTSHAYSIEDPLAGVGYPTPPVVSRACPSLNGNGNYTFQPGVYDCTINPNGNWTITFAPGDYLITGGIVLNGNLTASFGSGVYTLRGEGLKALGNTRITAEGSTFYIESGCLNLTGNQSMRFTAPSSGNYSGIAFFQNRSNTCTAQLSGNSASDGRGTVYIPSAQIDFQGNTSSTSFQLIADTVYMHGNPHVTINYNGGVQVGSPKMALVE